MAPTMADLLSMKQQHPVNTSEQWAAINPVLFPDEMAFESDTQLFKIGDGVHRWNDLPYSLSATNQIFPGNGIIINNTVIGTDLLYEEVTING